MTDREWRDIADELERMCDDFADAKGADFPLECARSLVTRIRLLIQTIREEHRGH